jgi:hypothetical protein
VAGPLVALGAVLATVATRGSVQFEQLAISEVAVASELSGYWYAAFDDGVRFLIVDGVEVRQRPYATAVVVHLAAPVVGLLALIVSLVLARGAAGQEPATTTV